MEKIDCIYRGCFRKNEDSTNRIIANQEICLLPTNLQFWKYSGDIPAGVKTRSKYKEQKPVSKRDYDRYFREKNRQDIER